MKINKKYLLIRIITSPIKLIFLLLWYNLFAVLLLLKWVKNGGQEVFYGTDFGNSIVELIETNKKLTEEINNNI